MTEYNGSNQLLRRYVHGPGSDEPLVWYEGSGTADRRWLHHDERGSVVALSNSAGAMLSINAYDEYGIPDSRNLGRFQYTGQTWLADLGMYYYKARVYAPRLGRFLQTDPIGYGDGTNLYAYVGNNPLNKTDSTGLAPPGCGDGSCPVTYVEIRAYPIKGAFGSEHEYIYARDGDTGRAVISSAGPNARYPAGRAVSNQTAKGRGSKENIKLVTERGPADEHSNRSELNSDTRTVAGSETKVKGSLGDVEQKLRTFNEAFDSAGIDYRPRTDNSNAYAGTAYRAITGKAPPENTNAPGSDRDLRPKIPACNSLPERCN